MTEKRWCSHHNSNDYSNEKCDQQINDIMDVRILLPLMVNIMK